MMNFWIPFLFVLYLITGFFIAAFTIGIARINNLTTRQKVRNSIVVLVNFLLWPLLLLYVLGVKVADSGESSVKQPPDPPA